MKYVGKSLPRKDARDKVTGLGRFTHDVSLPGMLHAKVLRSPHAHAKIISVDASEALAMPGVAAVLTKDNAPDRLFNASASMMTTSPGIPPVLDQRLFDDKVRYVGDEVAAVAAVSERAAQAALEKIRVEYELLPAVFDPLAAMEPEAPVIHECEHKNMPGEVFKLPVGDFEAAYAAARTRVETRIKSPVQKHAQLETSAAVADYGPGGQLTVYSTSQNVHPTKQILARIMDMPESRIRVLNPPYVGGGFGVRAGMSAKAEPIAAVLSRLSNRPVKYVYDRHEDFTCSDSRHSGYVNVRLGADESGLFTALSVRAVLNKGAYCSFGMEVNAVLVAMALSVYRVPNVYGESRCIYTNIQPAGAMRGFGSPQAAVAIEQAVDAMAQKLNMDPLELRQKNILRAGEAWYLPYPCNSSGLKECIGRAAESIGWREKRGAPKTGTLRRGVGLAVGTHVSNSAPFCVDYDCVYLALESDGSLQVATGAPDIGQGSVTALAQVAAEAMDVPYDSTTVVFSDTAATPFDLGSHASRTLYAVGHCILEAAKTLKQQMRDFAAGLWNTSADLIELADGRIRSPEQSLSLAEFCYQAHLRGKQFVTAANTVPPNAPPWHAHAAEVEVDMETGMIRVLKFAAAHDCGTAVNPMIVEGQIDGGVMMGIGYALREEITVDAQGVPYNDGYHKYMLPVAGDIPEIESILVGTYEDSGPFGAKGVGECGSVPTAPAILSAVENATGIRFEEFPLTPVRVLKGILTAGDK